METKLFCIISKIIMNSNSDRKIEKSQGRIYAPGLFACHIGIITPTPYSPLEILEFGPISSISSSLEII